MSVSFPANGIVAEIQMDRSTDEVAATSADYYTNSYAHFGIHEEMLKDSIRTESYRDAILKNPALFKDKVVLDVGCGTGILSMFAAQAGAKHVYAVDASNIITWATKIVDDNNMSDKITLIRGKIEEIELPVEKVDIIVSEWMGYFCVYESMLNSVLFARNKWLAEDGRMLPNEANLYVALIEDAEYKEEKVGFWNNVYGFDMSCMQDQVLLEPLVDIVHAEQVISTPCKVLTLDLEKCTVEDLTFTVPFETKAMVPDTAHAIVSWFDTPFSLPEHTVVLDTSPMAPDTHWKQTVFYLKTPLRMKAGDILKGSVACAPNPGNHRDLDISIKTVFEGSLGAVSEQTQYRLR